MFSKDFVVSIVVDGKIVKENKDIAKIPFGTEYAIRFRNKNRKSCAFDAYVDGERVNEVGQLVIWGNDFIDLQGFLKKSGANKRFKFVKSSDSRVRQPGESDNGIIEARFYLQREPKEVTRFVEHHTYYEDYRPIWIYDHHHNHHYYPRNPWHPDINPIYYEHGNTFCTSGGSANFTVDNKDLISTDLNNNADVNVSYASNGATVEGDGHDQTVGSTQSFELVSDPVVIRLQLEGFDAPNAICKCGTAWKSEDRFCGQCGKSKPKNAIVIK